MGIFGQGSIVGTLLPTSAKHKETKGKSLVDQVLPFPSWAIKQPLTQRNRYVTVGISNPLIFLHILSFWLHIKTNRKIVITSICSHACQPTWRRTFINKWSCQIKCSQKDYSWGWPLETEFQTLDLSVYLTFLNWPRHDSWNYSSLALIGTL